MEYLQVVPRYSAVIQGQPNLQEVPLNADHRSMTKFESPEDENFKRLLRIVNRMVRSAPVKIAENWADWDREQGQ